MTPMYDYDNSTGVTPEDAPAADPSSMDSALNFAVWPGHFETLGIRLVRGRTFEAEDLELEVPPIVIDAGLAETYWPEQDPIGKRVRVGGDKYAFRNVIGVVEPVRHGERGQSSLPQLYNPINLPMLDGLARFGMPLSLLVRTQGELTELERLLRQEVTNIDASQPLFHVKPLVEVVDAAFDRDRAVFALLAGFAGFAVVLAAVGLYGVITYSVSRRTKEIGVRLAVGATPKMVVRLIVSDALRLAFLGLWVGIVGAALASHGLTATLYGIKPVDATVYAATSALLLAVAWLASFVPARRAAAIDPVAALRRE
jgi:predicted lysophospholipase L1 biosynthesis ABC-type transport system permease subunit